MALQLLKMCELLSIRTTAILSLTTFKIKALKPAKNLENQFWHIDILM